MTQRRGGRVVNGRYTNGHVRSRRSNRYEGYRREYEDDYYDDFSDTTTGKIVGKMSETYNASKQRAADSKAAKKGVVCNNCEYDSCEKSGKYINIVSGEEEII